MLHGAQLPKNLWGEALAHTTWLKNCTSTKGLEKTMLLQALTRMKLDLSELHEWGEGSWYTTLLTPSSADEQSRADGSDLILRVRGPASIGLTKQRSALKKMSNLTLTMYWSHLIHHPVAQSPSSPSPAWMHPAPGPHQPASCHNPYPTLSPI